MSAALKSPFVTISLILMMLIIANIYAVRWGIADIHFHEAILTLTRVQQQNTGGGLSALNSYMENTLVLEDSSSSHLVNFGRIRMSPTYRGYLAPDTQDVLLQTVNSQYNRAIQENPLSATALAGYALSRYQLNDFDAEALSALNRAIELGAWVEEVQLVAAHIGLGLHNTLAPQAMEPITRIINNGFKWQQRSMIAIIQQHKSERWFCGQSVEFTSNAIAFCEREFLRK